MARAFRVPHTGSLEDFFKKARNMVEKNEANISGDANSGSFASNDKKVSGTYKRDGNEYIITIDKSPMGVGWLIERGIKKAIRKIQ